MYECTFFKIASHDKQVDPDEVECNALDIDSFVDTSTSENDTDKRNHVGSNQTPEFLITGLLYIQYIGVRDLIFKFNLAYVLDGLTIFQYLSQAIQCHFSKIYSCSSLNPRINQLWLSVVQDYSLENNSKRWN